MPKQEKIGGNYPNYIIPYKEIKAFTLIEVVVVIAIIGILAIVSWVSLGSSRKDVQIDSACNQAAAMINKAKGYALSGKVLGGKSPSSFSVTFSGSNVSISAAGINVETANLMGGVSCSGSSYTFSAPTGSCVGCANEVTCSVSGTTAIKKINVKKFSATCE